MMMGPMLISLMTATFSRNMALNARELRLMTTLGVPVSQHEYIVPSNMASYV